MIRIPPSVINTSSRSIITSTRTMQSSRGGSMIVRRNKSTLEQRLKNSSSSSKKISFLEGDAGAMATRVHHMFTTSLVVAGPLYMVLPEDGSLSRGLGGILTLNVVAHSWIGMNYCITDYGPKFFPKSFVGPLRMFNAGLAAVTLAGLLQMSFFSKGGIKGSIAGLWNLPPKKEPEEKK